MGNQLELAESLNRYFINSITKINNGIEKLDYEESDMNTNGSEFKFKQADTANMLNIVKAFKNKTATKKLFSEGVTKESSIWHTFLPTL